MYNLSLVSAFKFGLVSWRSLVSRDGVDVSTGCGVGVGFRLVANGEAGAEKLRWSRNVLLLDDWVSGSRDPICSLLKGCRRWCAGQPGWHRWHPAWESWYPQVQAPRARSYGSYEGNGAGQHAA